MYQRTIQHNLTNVTMFAALLKDVPKGCKHTLLPDPLLKNHSVKCLTFEESTQKACNHNLGLFRALVLHLHGNERLEGETSKLFNLFHEKTGGTDPSNFRGVCMEDFAAVVDNVQADFFLVWFWHCRRIYDWGAFEEECRETLWFCTAITL